MGRHAADSLADVGQRRDPVDVDERGRPRQPEVEQGHEALPTREYLGVAAVAREQLDRFVDARRRVIVELGRFHGSGCREAGSRRGWPVLEGAWLRISFAFIAFSGHF